MSADGIEIKRDRDGIRYVRPYLGINSVTGRPIRPYHRFPDAKTDDEALELAKRWLAEVAPSASASVTHRTGDLLARYVRWCEENGKSTNTVKTYRSLCRHAQPIASKPAREVRTPDLEILYDYLLTPAERGGKGLGGSTVVAFHWFLSGAFGWMARIGAVDVNPAASAEPPSPGEYNAVALEGDDFRRMSELLNGWHEMPDETKAEHVRRESAFAAYISLNTGMRCGEVCALRKSDVDLRRRVIRVCGTVVEAKGRTFRQPRTKGKRHRNVSITGELAEAIRLHERELAQRTGQPMRGSKAPLVTAGRDFMRPSTVSREFKALCSESGMPQRTTFHSLRHTHATWMLLQGVDVKTVSERLGHSKASVTLNIYSHVLPGRDAQAAEAFAHAADEAADW